MRDPYLDVRDECRRCGGGIENDHPNTCDACLYELRNPGRIYERDVDAAIKLRMTLAEYTKYRQKNR